MQHGAAGLARAKRAFKMDEASVVRSLYEAGREGFSVHRRLEQMAVENMIVDPASLEVCRVTRGGRSPARWTSKAARRLMAYGANHGRLAIVRVPKPEDEARQRLDREIELPAEEKPRGAHLAKPDPIMLFCWGLP